MGTAVVAERRVVDPYLRRRRATIVATDPRQHSPTHAVHRDGGTGRGQGTKLKLAARTGVLSTGQPRRGSTQIKAGKIFEPNYCPRITANLTPSPLYIPMYVVKSLNIYTCNPDTELRGPI